MSPSTVNLSRSLAVFILACVLTRLAAPSLIETKGWVLSGEISVAAMLVFVAYTIGYLLIGCTYIFRKKAYDRHIFPEGLRLEGEPAVKLGLKYLILSSISAFGATLIYAVILRGVRAAFYLQ